MSSVTVSARFQVVIPLEVRRRMHLEPGARLGIVEFNGELRLVPVRPPSTLRGIARGVDPRIDDEPDRAS